jgi:methylmalonyl-CoA mutase N-terminal domain/subunit
VNRYQLADEQQPELLRVDPAVEGEQVARVQAVRARRDAAAVEQALRSVREAADGEENLMPALIDAARVYATVGEMCDVLRAAWGTWRETPVF